MKTPSKSKRFSVAERRLLLARWQDSGLSCQCFGDQEGVPVQSLYRWRREFGKEPVDVRGFYEVKASPKPEDSLVQEGRGASIPIAELERHGVIARLYVDFPLAAVPTLLRALNEVKPC